MQPFRKNVAIAIDGGGIRGAVVTRALSILEEHLSRHVHDLFSLAAGTSTGSIISAGIGVGLSAREMDQLYAEMGTVVFKKSLRSRLWPLSRYRYDRSQLESVLKLYLGDGCMGDFWSAVPATDIVLTSFDLVENRTLFIKPWKEAYKSWRVVKAVLTSCAAPTYFQMVDGRYCDGGVGSYANPAYLAAYEAKYCLSWDPAETTLISLGTGRDPRKFNPGQADKMFAWDWIDPILGAFQQSAEDQQVNLVETFFDKIDFRRFQVDLEKPIEMDDPSQISLLQEYGEKLGQMILNDQVDRSMGISPKLAPRPGFFK
jgi:uncharacterized protein